MSFGAHDHWPLDWRRKRDAIGLSTHFIHKRIWARAIELSGPKRGVGVLIVEIFTDNAGFR